MSDVSPGSVHNLTAARRPALPALHTAIRNGLRVLADIGYIGAPGILLPVRKHPDLPQDLAPDNQTYHTLLRCTRARGQRAIAELKQRWHALATRHTQPEPDRPHRPSSPRAQQPLAITTTEKTSMNVVDEVGYIPFEAEAANLFFQLVSNRYERASVIVTSNKPYGRWGEVFGDETVAAAMIDRLVHHAEVHSPRVFA
ncbi:hypothetical protein GCM10022295_92750 [Streptomyces osmaniensis]|uniref:Transposase n=1 Tax=Streptomyces osmaniensis TaxID=593134 RepID=A0ABP6Z3E5_9ACTN